MSEIRRLDAQVVGISADSYFSHKAFAKELNLDMPLLADWFGAVGKSYEVWNDGKQQELRTVFVIDSTGTVAYRKSYRDDEVPDFEPVVDVLRHLREHQERMAG